MWVELVVGSFLCSERFFSENSGFPFFLKTITSELQFSIWNARACLTECYVGKKNYNLQIFSFLERDRS